MPVAKLFLLWQDFEVSLPHVQGYHRFHEKILPLHVEEQDFTSDLHPPHPPKSYQDKFVADSCIASGLTDDTTACGH